MKIKKYLLLSFFICSFLANSTAQTLVEYASAGDKAFAENDFQGAIDNYLKALELDTDKIDYTTAYNLGMAYENLGDNAKALETFKSSILLGNDERSTFAQLKSNTDAMNCSECLEKCYLEILEAKPENGPYINERLFYIYAGQKNNDKALETAYKVLWNIYVILENSKLQNDAPLQSSDNQCMC